MSARRFSSLLDTAAAALLRGLPMVVVVGLCALAAWRLAGWIWLAVPTPAVNAKTLEQDNPVSRAGARHWFGIAPVIESSSNAADGVAIPVASANIKLLGLIAGGRKTVAMLQVDQDTHEVFLGESFANALRFKSHGIDFVVIESRGTDIRVALPFSPPPDASGIANSPKQHQAPSPRRPNSRAYRP